MVDPQHHRYPLQLIFCGSNNAQENDMVGVHKKNDIMCNGDWNKKGKRIDDSTGSTPRPKTVMTTTVLERDIEIKDTCYLDTM
jgi:hypothetical protein